MAKTDWKLTDVVKPDDFNDIGQEINKLRGDLDNIDIPTASLTKAGITQLSSATDSEAEDRAATPKAVKAATDAARKAQNAADDANTAAATVQKELKDAIADIVINGTEAVEEVKKELQELETRLNTADTDEITLQPGLQVVSAAKDARFNLGSIKGKSEINGSGRIGIIGAENPYVIRYGENLLPPFYEWSQLGSSSRKIISPYSLSIDQKAAEGWQFVSYPLSVTPNTEYYLQCSHNMKMSIANADGSVSIIPYTEAQFIKFNSGSHTSISVYFSSTSIGQDVVYSIANPMLTLGTEAKPFKPREDSMLALQTELHTNPTDGSEPDVLFECEGQYFKLEKWKKVVLTSDIIEIAALSPTTSKIYKIIRLVITQKDTSNFAAFMTKYDGASLTLDKVSSPLPASDIFNVGGMGGVNPGVIWISVSNTDSGWGDAYTPTADEIKAYFWGWSMCNQDGSVPYDDNGIKRWKQIGKQGVADTNVLPTSKAPNRDPYNLLYRLAKETIEPVVSEGCLTLNEGDNVVEVGTGIVLREQANPKTFGDGNTYINNANPAIASQLRYKTEKILNIFKDGSDDTAKWVIYKAGETYGNSEAYAKLGNYDQSASYSVTYLKLDKSPVVPILGVVAANEKAQLSDLTSGVAEALHGVSILTQKKAEKDIPGWITPTLLNGASQYPNYQTVSYTKDSLGFVHLRGLLSNVTAGAPVFVLALKYRPAKDLIFRVAGQLESTEVRVTSVGAIVPSSTIGYLSLDGIIFEAEQ